MKTILSILLIVFLFSHSKEKYVFIFEHCRHGARGPMEINKESKDIFGEEWIGNGELSSVGLRQHYLLGARIKNKYADLFNEYNPNKIKVFSTNINRTIMSGYSQLQGIFPSSINNTLTSNQLLQSQPPFDIQDFRLLEYIKTLGNKTVINSVNIIPIHTMDDSKLNPYDRIIEFEQQDQCPKINNLYHENLKKKIMLDYIDKFNKTYGERLLKIFPDKTPNYYNTYEGIDTVTYAFYVDYNGGKNLSLFTNGNINVDEFYSVCFEYTALYGKEIHGNDKKGEIALANGSIIIRKAIEYIDKKLLSEINKTNAENVIDFLFVSGHDGTLIAQDNLIINIFGGSTSFATFASNEIFEITRDDNITPTSFSDYNISVLFDDQIKLNISYNIFRNKILSNSWDINEIALYCGFNIKNNGDIMNFIFILCFWSSIGLFSVLGIIMIILLILKCRENKPKVNGFPLIPPNNN